MNDEPMERDDGYMKYQADSVPGKGICASHDSLGEQLSALGEDVSALEMRLKPILRDDKTPKGDVLARALTEGLSPLHSQAEESLNMVRWIRARVQEINSRVAL